MSQIKQLLRMHQQGLSKSAIARNLSMSRNTVKDYLKKVASAQWSIASLLALEDPVLESKFHSGSPSYKDSRYDDLKDKLDYYVQELDRVGVTQQLLWEEYRQANPEGYGRSQFCYHLSRHLKASKPSMVLTHRPGEVLQVDFAGTKLSYVDRLSGEVIECDVFVACMAYSDYGFAMAVHSQTSGDFIQALKRCLNHLGGAPQVIVPDNMKTAIIKAHRYEPTINRALEDFANHYGITILPARVSKPKDKALVENQVKLVYNRVYAKLRNQTFFSLEDLNTAIAEKMKKHNQTRMQEKPHCREECFLAEERPLLISLPNDEFEIKCYARVKVAKNNHIRLGQDKHYYSVPYTYIGQTVRVIYTHRMVRIYAHGKPIAVHQRDRSPGKYSTKDSHLCSHHRHYLDRSPAYYLNKAKFRSAVLHELFTHLFNQDRHPEQLYKTCDGLLNMYRNLGAELVERACQMAIDHRQITYGFIRNIIDNKMTGVDDQPTPNQPLPEHDNIRGADYYKQLSLNI